MSNLEAALDVDLSIQLEHCWDTGIGRGGAFTSSKDPLAGYIGWSDHKAVQQKQRLSPCSMEICDANLRLDTSKASTCRVWHIKDIGWCATFNMEYGRLGRHETSLDP